ncbi:hypothetical protein [Thermococcus sp.]|uniref:hypothetical protein n=1 Tax=Thermococcus sp. TaxID=35749 RepID=UPI0019C2E934|nr:hypothetical protein [Thermococcus sp.]MBC7094934.1 hypothetical protein [Thermococcus sp.]
MDLLSSLTSIERELIKAMNLEVRKTSMKIKIENITKLDGILKGINAERMTGEIKDSNLWFEYYDRYIQISGEVSSDIVNWLKNLVTYLG